MKRVLHVIKSLGRGGSERLLIDVALRLNRSRFSPEVAYAFDCRPGLVDELVGTDVKVTSLGETGGRLAWFFGLRRLLRYGQYDVVHVHSPYIASAVRLLPRRRGVRYLYTEHAEWPAYHPVTRWANALTYWREDEVLVVSDQVRKAVRYPVWLRHMPLPQIRTVRHGVDLAALRETLASGSLRRRDLGLPEGGLLVGTVANFRREKGHEVLVNAAAQVHAALPDVHFVFVGNGPTAASVRRHVSALGLQCVISFAGYRDDAACVAALFDVFALPSLHEGLPIALIESMVAGKPAVVTAVGGTPELVEHERQGLVVPPGDAEAFAAALLKLLRNPAKRASMGRESVERAQYFSIDQTVSLLEAIYDAPTT